MIASEKRFISVDFRSYLLPLQTVTAFEEGLSRGQQTMVVGS